ncbi:undecaprenyl-phosphate 4-deoxy-4-formamido-L-arabinose transferase [bacterium BMS3Bbin11]|nr:undecaprenyl-phosphate 4-deoxy-4-formamido-L-arabinose transferase [bacterium BMS3Abin11]GBE45893.1 undecaprenyl-phosphate 4-deoxy-4-formamido-L-arabinose transferase [bacterium BMS3Bbin11]GMT39737.1 MAG: dolichol-phosphate mannosyltransferase [bacterium]HDH17099.1 glycosyltransferase family 2 protein [Gammaproteobacteria bacterium]HDZ77725.1 glycosyltransferase family 2 protein [Gammaproteobacteria bacterium]
MPDLSVVIPVQNEEENIRLLIEEVRQSLDGVLDYELIYVNDGSSDATLQILEEYRAGFPLLYVISHKMGAGQSTALRTGINQAKSSVIATLDGDGQNDPADIPALYQALEKHADSGVVLVNGYRKKRKDTYIKRVSSRLANGIRGWLLNDDTPDTGCGLKVFSREAYLAIPFFDHLHRFLPAMMINGGGKVMSVEVNHRERQLGSSHYGFFDRLWVGIFDIMGVIWLKSRTTHPVVMKDSDDDTH